MSFKGDFRKLGEIVERIAKVARGDFVKASSKALGEMAFDKAQQGVSAGQAPSGRSWKKLKLGGGAPLRELAGSLRLTQYDGGFKIASSLGWAIYHQTGAKRVVRSGGFRRGMKDGKLVLRRVSAKVGWRLPARRVLPYGALPKSWSEPMVRRLVAEWAKRMR